MRATEVRAITLQPMLDAHVRAVQRIEAISYPRPWTTGMFASELAMGDARTYLVATDGDTVVGYGGVLYVLPDAHITTIAVHPDARRGRVASRLLLALLRQAIERGATALTLEVRVSNDAAQALYRRFGFAPAGARKAYYPPDGDAPAEDALVMWAHDIDRPPFAARLAAIDVELRS